MLLECVLYKGWDKNTDSDIELSAVVVQGCSHVESGASVTRTLPEGSLHTVVLRLLVGA